MLLGRKAYHLYKRRQHKSFFFPQRLWMALALSLWIQMLMTLFFVNSVRWVDTAISSAQEFNRKLSSEAQHHAAIDEATRFAPAFRALMMRLDAVYAERVADAPEDFKPRIDFWQRECGMSANLCAELHELRKWSNAARHLDDERWAKEGPQSEEQAAERLSNLETRIAAIEKKKTAGSV